MFKNKTAILALASFFANIVLALILFSRSSAPAASLPPEPSTISDQDNHTRYPLLSKRIFVENSNDILINFIPLRQALREYIEKQENKIGLYFEYLPTGVSIGINDKEEVTLASLTKVPIAMSIFKKIEKGQLSTDKIVSINKENLDRKFGNLWEKGEGAQISINDLLRLALVESDNTAYRVLFDQLSSQEINEVYENLDIPLSYREEEEEEEEGGGEIKKKRYPQVSPKNFSSIFRSLYLSSFLRKENSNRILEILTQAPFNDKIAAGVPEDIKVSHKIGVFEKIDISKTVYTDCGIIYAPSRPYILCAFVQDSNEAAKKHMSHLSKMIYGYIAIVKGN